jgi:hypothetical protein
MDPTRARALVRLERAVASSEPFARAYRSGELSWVKATLLVPLVAADPLGRFMAGWIAWARRVTVRRLREDVDYALTLEYTDRGAFRQTGGLPADREIGAQQRDPAKEVADVTEVTAVAPRDVSPPAFRAGHREIGAPHRDPTEACSVRFFGPPDVVQLFQAVLCTVRRRIEHDVGRLPTRGDALGAMLDHVLSSWGVLDGKVAARHRVFARDGWRIAR